MEEEDYYDFINLLPEDIPESEADDLISKIKEKIDEQKNEQISKEIKENYEWNISREDLIKRLKHDFDSRIKAELFLDIVNFTLYNHFEKKLDLKKSRRNKNLIENSIKNFLLNCVRKHFDLNPISLEDELFEEIQIAEYTGDKKIHNDLDLKICSNCGSNDIEIDKELSKTTCRKCGVVNNYISSESSYEDMQRASRLTKQININGYKVYFNGPNGLDGVVNRLDKKIDEYIADYNQNIDSSKIKNEFKRLIPKSDFKIESLKIIVVETFIRNNPIYYKPEKIKEILDFFKLKKSLFNGFENFVKINILKIKNEELMNISDSWSNENVEKFKEIKEYLIKTEKFNHSFSLEELATLKWMITKTKREEIAKEYGVQSNKMTNLRNELKNNKKFKTKFNTLHYR